MTRAFLVACVSLLLLGMQQHAAVHEIGHARAKIERCHDVAVHNPSNGACVECALLAAGSGAIPSAASASADVTPDTAAVRLVVSGPRARPFPAAYLSRAPPAVV